MKYVGKLHLSTVLVLEIETATAIEAAQVLKEYEDYLLSLEWGAKRPEPRVIHVRELSYASGRALSEQKPEGLQLG
jgi:hypothetical protein